MDSQVDDAFTTNTHLVCVVRMQQLSQVELLCQQLYESASSQVRTQAEKTLMGYFESPNAPAQCQVILEQSQVG